MEQHVIGLILEDHVSSHSHRTGSSVYGIYVTGLLQLPLPHLQCLNSEESLIKLQEIVCVVLIYVQGDQPEDPSFYESIVNTADSGVKTVSNCHHRNGEPSFSVMRYGFCWDVLTDEQSCSELRAGSGQILWW